MKQLELSPGMRMRRQFGFFDDFLWFISPHLWTATLTDTGTAAVGDAAGGIITLTPSDGTVADNDEAYISTTNELFLLAAEKPLLYEARVQFTEAATNAANVMVGFADAVGANTILDNGGGPPASYSGAVIYKVDGGTVWNFETSLAGTQTTTASQHTAGGSSYQVLRIEIRQGSSGASGLEAVPFLNGQQMLDANGKPIKHAVTYTSATEMKAFAGVKNGSGSLETLLIDYIGADQLR